MTLSVTMIINIVLILGLVISYLVYKVVCINHQKDPTFKAKEEERLRELKRQQRDNESLDEYMASSDDYDNYDE
ncbi:MAG: hypothetical protein J6M44_16250 [Butyrivibrio sp.]|uniref:hypothetical protein n=1 Tax=Butyrivibrio sp. TaxID=28121 RepID=UPI001B45C30A|nr:hypothetical protein [Butyrivibrio sp.]MBP3280500.1 hypothetical protein [Butyrivibrio sp.]MBP3782084.1 hypothetical protein [Butyrivibrio sp.]